MPSKPLNKQHHKIELKLPEGFLKTGTTIKGIPKARIAGAAAAGFGTYLMVRVFQKTAGDVLRAIVEGGQGLFAQIFNVTTGAITGTKLEFDPGVKEKEELIALDPFATSMGLVVGGMILAGQNPGEVLKGIGEIIPG